MENRLKERLTGAAILVALIVLIVPEIFRGQPTKAGAAHAQQALEGAPVRSYTIDLNATSTPNATSTSNGAQTASPSVGLPPGPPAAAPAPAAAAAAAQAPLAPPAVPHGPAAAASRAATGAGTRPRSLAHATTVHATPEHAAASGGTGWSVQLGLFSKPANATRLAHTAHGKGFDVHVSRSPRGLYRVALIDLTDRAAALRAARRLKAAGLSAAIMGPR